MHFDHFSLMTTLSFNSVPSDPFTEAVSGPDQDVRRVKSLVETIQNYGVDKKYIFAAEDLWEGKNIPKVVRCLEEVEKFVSCRRKYYY